jgi:hypothetical protein
VFFAVLGGFEMVRRSTAHALEVHTSNISKLLRGKIDVEEYRAKTATLHAEINDLRVKVAILEDRNAQR